MEAILAHIQQNMQTKVDAQSRMDELKNTGNNITKEFMEKVEKLQDTKYKGCQTAIGEPETEFEDLCKGTWSMSGDGGLKRSCNSATRASSLDG